MSSSFDAAAVGSIAPPHRAPALIFPGLAGFYAAAGPLSYALMRVAFGLILLTHGLPKILGGGHGSLGDPLASATNFIDTKLHFPRPGALRPTLRRSSKAAAQSCWRPGC